MRIFKILESWLCKPLPFFETTKQKLIISIVFGVFITVFLILFTDSPQAGNMNVQLIKAIAYGVLTFIVLFFYSYVLPIIFPNFFNSEKWNMGRSIIYGIILVVSIGVFNALFAFKFDNPNNRENLFPFLLAVIQRTFIVSIIPTLMFNIWLERRFYKMYHSRAKSINESLSRINSGAPIGKKINLGEKAHFLEQDIVYIKAEGNYCQIYYVEESNPQKIILRNTLKNIEASLKNSKRILRCHKSYIINLDKVIKVTGNAKGYNFIVDEFTSSVPVSRDVSKELISKITSN